MLSVDQAEIRSRQLAYALTLLGVIGGYFLVRNLPWHGSLAFLLSVEWASTILSVCVGTLSLIRFYSRKEITFLFVGTGFIINGVLDGIHAATTSSYILDILSDYPLQEVAWSWYTSRLFLPVLLWLSWFAGNREGRLGPDRHVSDGFVYLSVGLLALVFYLLFQTGALPAVSLAGAAWVPYREYLPAVFLCMAWAGYYRDGGWKTDVFQHWLLLAIMAAFMREALLMPAFQQDYAIVFSAAHVLNLACYVFAFIGLLFNLRRLFSASVAHQELVLKNIVLATQQETSLDAIVVVDEQGVVISYNRRFLDLWRVPEGLVRTGAELPLQKLAVGQVKDPEAFLARVRYLNEHKWEKGYDEVTFRDGRIIDRYSAPMVGRDGRYYGRIWYFRDITEKKRRQQALEESEARFRSLVDLSLVGIALIEDSRFGYVNRKLADTFGYSVQEMLEMAPAAMATEKAIPAINRILSPDNGLTPSAEFTFEGRRKDGTPLHIEGRSARTNFDGKPGLILTLRDVTEQVHAQQEVEKLQGQLLEQAIRDPLTRLYNRRYFDDVIGRELSRAERGGYPLALVMGDIDYFKDINDTYGHPAGDAVLRRFAELLRRHSRGGDILCRYGGEEFVLLLPHMDLQTACERAERLRREFAATEIGYQSMMIRATASFGVAAFSVGQGGESLVASADKALYQAKRAGRNRATCAA